MLSFCQSVNLNAPVGKFPACYVKVNFPGDKVKFLCDAALVIGQILCAQGLDCKGHVHDLCRVAVSGGKVHQPAFCNDVDAFSVLKGVGLYVGPCGGVAHGHGAELCHGNLHVKVSGVREDRAVLQREKMLFSDHAAAAGNGDENVAQGGGLGHRQP